MKTGFSHILTYTCMHTHTHTYTHTCMHTRTCTHVHAHTHTHAHAHTRICTQKIYKSKNILSSAYTFLRILYNVREIKSLEYNIWHFCPILHRILHKKYCTANKFPNQVVTFLTGYTWAEICRYIHISRRHYTQNIDIQWS